MKRFSMSWYDDIKPLKKYGGCHKLPDSWDSDYVMVLARIAKEKRITSDVSMTEYDNTELDAYGVGEIISQVSLTEIWDHIDANGDIEDLVGTF
ncbi:hypothetical protein LCGC14_0351830 [marine sediment metagenome]|uniref:Uncharacterized protein n=1 Tax=marine sediment metagenome TaxID=412755 RepID=A0A0F9TGF6_9ZZZZ